MANEFINYAVISLLKIQIKLIFREAFWVNMWKFKPSDALREKFEPLYPFHLALFYAPFHFDITTLYFYNKCLFY